MYARTITEILSAYIRERCQNPHEPAVDVQAALTVLGRRRGGPYDNEFQGVDLSRCHLERYNLSWANLRGCTAVHANFNYCDLSMSNLSDAKLAGATFVEARAWGTTLTGAYAAHSVWFNAVLTRATCTRTNFKRAAMQRAHAEHARFEEARLDHADLTLAQFSHASLRRANLTGAILAGADFTGADTAQALLQQPMGEHGPIDRAETS